MNGTTDEPRPGGLIDPARLADFLRAGERPARYAPGGIVLLPADPARHGHVMFGVDIGCDDTGVIVVRPTGGGEWDACSTLLQDLQGGVSQPPTAEEIMAVVDDFMDRFESLPEPADARRTQLRFDGVSTSQLPTWGATGVAPASHEPGRGAEPADIVEQIDRAVARLCPCGAAPSEESAPYCSYDCQPNHVAVHTDIRLTGPLATPSRWRPDLVSAVDDTGLVSVRRRQRRGRFWAEIFERAGTDLLHLRLDDDVRFVGADVPRGEGDEHERRCARKWAALERELTDDDHAVATDRDDLYVLSQTHWAFRAREQARREQRAVLLAHQAQRAALLADPGRPQHVHWAFDAETVQRTLAGLRAIAEPIRQLFAASAARITAGFDARAGGERPEDARERALRLRRERNTGPQPQPQRRVPRSIKPRGSR